jgi:RNA polymerase sigma factor (sigma-70 family)
VVDPYMGRLLAFARRRAPGDADAEDAVQDACVHAWLALDDLRDDENAAPWLYQILRNVLHRRYETDARRERLAATTRWDDGACACVASDEPSALESLVAARRTRPLNAHYGGCPSTTQLPSSCVTCKVSHAVRPPRRWVCR